jgi:hypothetical protein
MIHSGSKRMNIRNQNPQAEDGQQSTRHQVPHPALPIRTIAKEPVTQIDAESAGYSH